MDAKNNDRNEHEREKSPLTTITPLLTRSHSFFLVSLSPYLIALIEINLEIIDSCWYSPQFLSLRLTVIQWNPALGQGCQPPTSSNIENWQGRDNRWRHNARNMASFVQKTCEKDVVGIVTFVPDWFTSHQSHNCLYYNGVREFLRKRSMLKVK